MSAPSISSDISASSTAPERQALDAAIALAPTISVERVVQETAQQIRRATGCDAIAIALSDIELGPLELVHQTGFEQEGAELAAELSPSWKHATAESATVVRDLPRGKEITVPLSGGDIRGAITVLVSNAGSRSQVRDVEQIITSIAAQAASAVDRARDIDRLAQRWRLEAISEVSAGIARELRNPLFGISSAAQLLRFRVRDDPVVERNVGRILREVERLNGVVSSLLEYGRPAPLHTTRVDPDAVWHAVLTAKRGLLESRALVMRHRPAEPRASRDIDAEQIGNVFANVLSNAVDAAPEGSDLTLTSATLASGAWRCRLHNDGPPISPELLPRVFELFFSTKPGAAGVGLALCQRILDDHGGTINLESTADKGTTVTITLPDSKSDEATVDSHG